MRGPSRRKLILAVAAALIVAAGALYAFHGDLRDAWMNWQKGPIPIAVTRAELENANAEPVPPTPTSAPKPAPVPKPKPAAPTTFNLSVLFVPQAPLSNWDKIHEDTCEEASMMMARTFLDGRASMTREDMDKELLAIVDYENRTLGFFESTTAAQTADVMAGYYHMTRPRVIELHSIADVRAEIAAGHPVMLPTAGRLLHNPNFKNGGPLYHMVVAKGYVGGKVITNDPGTRLGADYVYDDATLWNAIHDWNGGDVLNGGKVMIVAPTL